MLKDIAEWIGKQSVLASTLRVVPNVDPRKTVLMSPTGTLLEFALQPPLQRCKVDTLESLIEWGGSQMSPEYWVAEDRVICVADGQDRREWATYMMLHSDRWISMVQRLGKPQLEGFTQEALIKFLRLKMYLPEAIVGRFRALSWTSGEDAAGVVQRGADKLGRQIRNEMINAADLPEEIVISSLYVYRGLEVLTFDLPLLVEIDVTQRLVFLVPKPDALTKLVDVTLAGIGGIIQDNATNEPPIYFGQPS